MIPSPVYIVTLINSCNSGAFLQAYALGEAIQQVMPAIVTYIDTGARSTKNEWKTKTKRAVKRRQLPLIPFSIKKSSMYERVYATLDTEPLRREYGSDDYVVFGSDEIWNVGRKQMNRYPALWGQGFLGGRRVSYAPTANGAAFNEFEGVDEFASTLRGFSALSARDDATAQSIRELTEADVQVVCDPTLLLDVDAYRRIQEPTQLQDYLLVYSYGNDVSKDEIADIREFAKEKGLSIVSADNYLPWCDKSIVCGPLGFLGLMDRARYVVTDTFHGTIFSVIYGKQFVSYARNAKVEDLQRQLHIEERNPRTDSLAACFERPVAYDDVQDAVERLRIDSFEFLTSAFESATESDVDEEACDPIPCQRDIDLAKMTTLKMGGAARRLYLPVKDSALELLPKDVNGAYRIISGGSNLIINDKKVFDGVISMADYDRTITALGDGLYEVGCSVRGQKLIRRINEDGYGGIEELVSVPGMVGGLVCMNASVPSAHVCISDYLVSVEAFADGAVKEYPKDQCGFGYRKSRFQDGKSIILSARFKFPRQDQEESRRRIRARMERCHAVQDRALPNVGSVYAQKSAKIMRIVRKVGLHKGGARFSKKTDNWILNDGGTFADMMWILEFVERAHSILRKPFKREVVVWK